MSITITHQAFSEALQSRDGRLDYCIRLQAERQLGAAVEFTASDQSFPCSLYSLTPAETKAARRLKFALNIDVFFGFLKAKLKPPRCYCNGVVGATCKVSEMRSRAHCRPK